MTAIPTLTAAEATVLRGSRAPVSDVDITHAMSVSGLLSSWGTALCGDIHYEVSDLGRKALAAYDAERERAIRAKAIAECVAVVREELCLDGGSIWSALLGDSVAKEIERSVKP